MNQFGQQGFNGNQASFGNQQSFGMNQAQGQQNRYQPSGYVQSHYQGSPRQAGSISAQSNTGPVISQLGYSAGNANNQPYSSQNSFGGATSYTANSSQPVINHFGGYQAQNAQYSQQPSQQSTHYMQSSQPVLSHLGDTSGQDALRNHGSNFGMSAGMGSMGMQNQSQQYGATQYTSHAGNNPVLQSTGLSNQGPVISRYGFTAGGQQSFAGNQQSFAGNQQSSAGGQQYTAGLKPPGDTLPYLSTPTKDLGRISTGRPEYRKKDQSCRSWANSD